MKTVIFLCNQDVQTSPKLEKCFRIHINLVQPNINMIIIVSVYVQSYT